MLAEDQLAGIGQEVLVIHFLDQAQGGHLFDLGHERGGRRMRRPLRSEISQPQLLPSQGAIAQGLDNQLAAVRQVHFTHFNASQYCIA